MADLDENPTPAASSIGNQHTKHSSSSNGHDAETQLSDNEDELTQDYRFLNTSKSNQSGSLLPRRGEKDFEPHGTQAQSSTLAASQAAMHDALSFPRIHGPTVAGGDEAGGTKAKAGHLIGIFQTETGFTFVPKESGVWFRTMGRAVKGGRGGCMLEPEEALWLCERGTMEMKFPANECEDQVIDGMCSLEGITMSLQAVYACCIGSRGLTLERYVVYAGLKRAGFTVFRANGGWDDDDDEEEDTGSEVVQTGGISLQDWLSGLISNILPSSNSRRSLPLIGTGFFRDYRTIYKRLAIIQPKAPITYTPPSKRRPRMSSDLSVTYHAYRPSTQIKKTSLPAPEFHISVLDARETSIPTAKQLDRLLSSIKPAPEPVAAAAAADFKPPNLYTTLKSGGASVILAVVDSGLVSYMRVADGMFGREKVWMRNPTVVPPIAPVKGMSSGRGGKGAAAGRGRGRGRGKGVGAGGIAATAAVDVT